jgi:uncharacterized membrane protein YeaQ/YmgE (transglycosylase-associated protein family)
MILHVIGLIVVGLIVGALGRLFHPGSDPLGLLATIGIGVASVLIAGLLIGGFLGFVLAIVIGVALVALWSWMLRRRHPGGGNTLRNEVACTFACAGHALGEPAHARLARDPAAPDRLRACRP